MLRVLPVALISGFVLASPSSGTETPAPWTIGIAAQTGARGELMPCHCPGNPTGGLSRRSAILARFRGLPHGIVAVDGGDFAPDPGDTLREASASLMLDAMTLMNYGAVGVGENELLMGRAFLAEAAAKVPLVGANLQLPPELAALLPRVRWVRDGDRRVAVTACVDPALYYEHPEAWTEGAIALTDAWTAVDSVLAAVRDSADLTVVLAHAPFEAIEAWLATNPDVDVVIEGHEPSEGRQAPVGPPFLMRTGPFSRKVGFAVLRVDDAPSLERYGLYDLMASDGSDERIDRLVDAFRDAHGWP